MSETVSHSGDLPFWLVSTQKTGHINQCLALLDALGVTLDRQILIPGKSASDSKARKRVLWFRTLARITMALVTNRLPRGTVIVSSGNSSLRLCRLWRRLCGDRVFIIHVGEPERDPDFANIFIAASYLTQVDDPAPQGGTCAAVLRVDGVLARNLSQPGTQDSTLQPGAPPRLAVLIGGKNITFDYDGPKFAESLARIRKILEETGGSADVVLSRRTFERTVEAMREGLSGTRARIIGVADREGFRTALASASHFLVSPDSLTMVSECCSTGKPVYVLNMDRTNGETMNTRFLESFRALGYIRSLDCFDPAASTVKLEDQAANVSVPVRAAIMRWADRR